MDIKEFKTIEKYLEELKNPPTLPKWEKPKDSVKNAAFPTVMSAFLTPIQIHNFYVRDYLDKDSTFAMVTNTDTGVTSFGDMLKIYLDAKDYIEQVTYMKAKNTGIIEFFDVEHYYTGFWIHYQ